MFVQNQIKDLDNHRAVIADALTQSDEACFVVAYVRENGVDMILENIGDTPAKLLCSFDMGITQISGIKKLLQHNIEVKVYRSNDGTFHPKVWLFKRANKWSALIGSANLTQAALVSNVEASVFLEDESITTNAVMFFNYLWNATNAESVTMESIAYLQAEIAKRRSIKKQYAVQRQSKSTTRMNYDVAEWESVMGFVQNWIDISKWKQKNISSLWRGWYIIPDHGYVSDTLVENLAAYAAIIGKEDMHINRSAPNAHYHKLLDEFVRRSAFKRSTLKLKPHDLFTRQAKNYLIKFGWAHHPLIEKSKAYKVQKNILRLTDLGRRIADNHSLDGIQKLYSEYFEEYEFNGLCLVKFTRNMLKRFEYLDLSEFNYFVTHAYSEEDIEVIAELVSAYRRCQNKDALHNKIEEYFAVTKGCTGSNVYGNYVKSVKHTMSVIAWCTDFVMSEDFVIRLNDTSHAR